MRELEMQTDRTEPRRTKRVSSIHQEEVKMTSSNRFTRRRFLATTAAASAVTLAPPYIRTANAAGSISVGFWDH
ncbi:MAG: hypothetical protein MUP61_08665, partial [Burkholderiales bacterium]|nr:hypothetical protein [Burkholderiales bacterium]